MSPASGQAGDERVALALTNITCHFGSVRALRDVSMTVRAGTVHALLGENGAGKTTLMRIAFGMVAADTGTIAVDGVTRHVLSPRDAIAAGLGMVHQHFTLVPEMTVAENLALGGRGPYTPREAARVVEEVSAATGFTLDPNAVVASLSVGAQQRVEIAKALSRNARVLVLDEPTGVLAPAEVDELLRWLRTYVGRGNAVVLITHKLREALAVADEVTVLRRGERVLTAPVAQASEQSLTTAMIGGDLEERTRPMTPSPVSSRIIFRARRMSIRDAAGIIRIRDASFEVGAGEIVGIVGVEGSGQRELLRALAGRSDISGGSLERPPEVGFVPEDRHGDAVLLDRSLTENVALRGLGRRRGVIDWAGIRQRTRELMSAFDVRADGPEVPMRVLSGGNQQKLVLARELGSGLGAGAARGVPPERQDTAAEAPNRHHAAAVDIDSTANALVVENPTRGLDVRATAAVHARLREAAAAGAAVVLYASDLDEVLLLASRVLVVFNGAVLEPAMEQGAIGRAMLGLAG